MLTEKKEVFRAQNLVASASVPFTQNFPVGELWTRLILRLQLAIVIGTGAGAISEGELNIIKGITLRSDKGELIYSGTPGRLLYRMDQFKMGTAARRDAIAAATATYQVLINLWFIDPLLQNPYATVLDTRRYNAIQLEFLLGSLTDLYTAPGTATLTPTLDCTAEYLRGRPKATPVMRIEHGIRPPVDPNSFGEINMERARNLSYMRYYVLTSSAPSAGVPFSGTPNNGVLADFTIDHGVFPFDRIQETSLREVNKQDYSLESVLTGFYVFDFVDDGRVLSSLFSGDKSKLLMRWTNAAGMPNPAQVSLGYQGVRPVV